MIKLSKASTPELRDGVEVFLYPSKKKSTKVLFLFLSNRRRLQISCKPAFAALLKQLAKKQPLSTSLESAGLEQNSETINFLSFLEEEGIITLANPLDTDLLPAKYIDQYKRQIYFLIDILKSPQKALEVQKIIFDAHITLFGLGAIGSGILLQLCMMGFRNFTIVDHAQIEENDIARTPYKVDIHLEQQKTSAAQQIIYDTAYDPHIQKYDVLLKTTTNIDDFIKGTSMLVNTADEPYIGYTNIKLSRYALKHNIPLFVAGGFDAHLASLGELLIPNITPCADCYATFFENSLKSWKPIPHPVKDRESLFGGLGSLSNFSSSAAALEILSYFINQDEDHSEPGGRGEFLFHDYSLDTFTVERDEECQYCGGHINE